MRTTLSLACFLFLLVIATPAEAQLRQDLAQPAPAAVYDEDGGQGRLQNLMSTLFSDEHFQMSHTYEMSFSSFGGESASLGMYTNSMQWHFNDAWAARVDLSLAHNPFGGGMGLNDGQNLRVFLRNAEVSYRPNENMQFRLQVRQSPYGRYAAPYGYAGFDNGFYDRSPVPQLRAPFQKDGLQ